MASNHPEELFTKRLDQYIDRYAGEIGYARVEELLQARAQDMRELSEADDEAVTIQSEDMDGWRSE